MKKLAEYFAKGLGFVLLWFFFVYQISLPEFLAGVGAAALTLFALEKALHPEPLHFKPELRWYAQLWRMPVMIAEDLWILLHTLARHTQRKPSEALFQITPFRTSGDESHQAAQRCLATVFMSVSPNAVVVDIDTEQDVMMFHQVKKAPVPTIVRKLEE